MRVVLCVCVISAGMIGAALAIGCSSAVADCLAEPNRDPPPGRHWYYHVDHANDRKCWYMHETVEGPASPPAMELQSVHPLRRQAAPLAEPQRRQAGSAADLPRRQGAVRQVAAPRVAAPQVGAPQVAAPQGAAPRSEADEAALYLEFLRWKEQHRGAQ